MSGTSLPTIATLRRRFHALADALGATSEMRSFNTAPRHDGSVHVEFDGRVYYWIVTERGTEFERRSTGNPDELLYWLFRDVAKQLARNYEVAHRIEDEDSRRKWFRLSVEYLESINGGWAKRLQNEYDDILSRHPFNDR